MEIRPLEIHEKVEESAHSAGFSFGLPRKIHIPGEGFRRALNSRGSQSAVYLTQGIQQLYGAMNTISKFGIGRGIPATLGIGTIGYYESDMHTVTHHDYTFDSEIQAKEYIDLEVGKGRLSGKMKAGRSIRIKSNNPLELISGYDEVRRDTEHESVGINANVLSLTGGISYQEGYHNSRERGVRRAVLEAAEIDIPEIRYDGMRELHESTGHTFGCGFEIGEKHPSISISYGKEKNGDGVSFGINLDVSSKEAFMKSAQEAIKGGVNAAVIGQIAQKAGMRDFWSSIAGTITSTAVTDTESGMESRENITITHDGHTTSSEIISINFNQLRQDFDEFLDKVSPREVNYETDQIPENIEGNIKRFLLESGANSEEVEELMTEGLLGIIRTRSELNLEIRVKLKGQKYFSDSLKECAKLFVDAACYIDEFAGENPRLTNFALQATNYILGGPVKYVMGIAAERIGITEKLDEFETKIADWTKLELIKKYSLNEQVADVCASGMVFAVDFGTRIALDGKVSSVLERARNVRTKLMHWHSPEMVTSEGIKIKPSEMGSLEERFGINYAKRADKSTSRKAAPKVEHKIERKVASKLDADNYLQGLKSKGVLSNKGITKDGREYYEFTQKCEHMGVQFRKGDLISRDKLHHEWELFRGISDHQGAIDPITGKLDIFKAKADRILKLP